MGPKLSKERRKYLPPDYLVFRNNNVSVFNKNHEKIILVRIFGGRYKDLGNVYNKVESDCICRVATLVLLK